MAKVLLTFLLVIATALGATSGAPLAAQEDPGKLNIVYVVTDDMSYTDLQHMPHVQDLLVLQGMSFSKAYAPLSSCCPSRASALTGKYPHNHGVWSNMGPAGGAPGFKKRGNEASTMATWLKDAGYTTALFGKYLNDYTVETHIPRGWDRWFAKLDPHGAANYDYDVSDQGRKRHYGTTTNNYWTDVLDREVLAYLDSRARELKPFFLYVAPSAPHESDGKPPISAERHKGLFSNLALPQPPNYNEDTSDKNNLTRNLSPLTASDKKAMTKSHRQRVRSLQSVDEMVGDIIGKLQAQGKLADTYIVFTSDNGFHHGEHRYKMTKRTPYDEALHLPLVVRGPGISPNTSTEQIALTNDFAPTFAEWGDAAVPADVDGRSLDPILKATATGWRSAFLTEDSRNQNTDSEKAWRGVQTSTRKYLEFGSGFKELYALETDPYELNNVYDGTPPADLKARLEALTVCTGATCRTAEDSHP